MPLYDYACTKCGRVVEVRHGFDENYEQPCQTCGEPVRRVFNPAPVLFKGSGFYVTDSRRSSGSGKGEKPKEGASTPAPAKADGAPSKESQGDSKSSDSAA
jgi:putative FmdB family regulatory protein